MPNQVVTSANLSRRLCSSNIPGLVPETTDWCNRYAGHTKEHISRNGRRWDDETRKEG